MPLLGWVLKLNLDFIKFKLDLYKFKFNFIKFKLNFIKSNFSFKNAPTFYTLNTPFCKPNALQRLMAVFSVVGAGLFSSRFIR